MAKAKATMLTADELAEFKEDNFPFENIAFEGGGSKGTAHIGAVRVLEELGVWKNMRRFAGTSAGSMVALCGALGMDSHEMEAKMTEDSQSKLFDQVLKHLAFLPNMIWHFGWHPAKKMEKWIGDILAERLGSADATFEDLYIKKKMELCVVTSNVNQMDCQYCHVKTTPDMPIREAVRASISLPVVVFPVLSRDQYFVDGGMINNYPIRCFDGWYLSMEQEDSLLLRIADLEDVSSAWLPDYQFGHTPNKKTIGVLLYSADERELFKDKLEERAAAFLKDELPLPNTKIAKDHKKKYEKVHAVRQQHEDLANAMTAFIKLLKNHTDITKATIPADALKSALEQAGDEFTEAQRTLLFPDAKNNDDVVKSIDTNEDGQISMRELTKYAEHQGSAVRSVLRGYASTEINSLSGFFQSLLNMVMLNCKRFFFERFDVERTIGVDTGYLGTLDLQLEPDDLDYLLQQGKRGCLAFLRYYKSQPDQGANNEDK